ncbi:50S ribosomal protein L28 [Candidatus Berkelbacteria bacterium]|nr:50S ribosomal protein L28 [Candidatus Berkelbacteria bacterium]
MLHTIGYAQSPKIGSRRAYACELCGKVAATGFHKPNSQHRTKRTFAPNLTKQAGTILCTRCWRSLKRGR